MWCGGKVGVVFHGYLLGLWRRGKIREHLILLLSHLYLFWSRLMPILIFGHVNPKGKGGVRMKVTVELQQSLTREKWYFFIIFSSFFDFHCFPLWLKSLTLHQNPPSYSESWGYYYIYILTCLASQASVLWTETLVFMQWFFF